MRTVGKYTILGMLGSGSYSKVFLAKDTVTKEKVALKLIKPDPYYGSMIEHEVSVLNICKHDNVVKLLGVCKGEFTSEELEQGPHEEGQCALFLVFETLGNNLAQEMKLGLYSKLNPTRIKFIMRQILEALAHCHKNNVLHLDIKLENILLDSRCNAKLIDFGLARMQGETTSVSSDYACTLEYRAPELILGCTEYTPAIDIWATGCLFAHLLLWTECGLFGNVDDEGELIRSICRVCRHPTEDNWPGVSQLRYYPCLVSKLATEWKEDEGLHNVCLTMESLLQCPNVDALQLLEKMLVLDPSKRITAEEALTSQYFIN